ncbi:MAG: hypothetical protein ABF629_04235 [Sporolactobacillus sp.]|nr:hypothetical protein [Sporolactobacillus sp. STSJ-5]MCQ2009293.1 hypothetical protein [Sporolactobacillus sp. STSJ-5]
MIQENNRKLNTLKKYEIGHHNDLLTDPIYWAVVHEIEYLDKENKEIEA